MKNTFMIIFFVLFYNSANAFELKSNDIESNGVISEKFVYNGMGCSGENISPELHWTKVPKKTKSFAITVYDPDAPTGSGWWHWIVQGISPATVSIPRGWKPTKEDESVVGDNSLEVPTDFGSTGYNGPCPPPGKPHRYVFTVYALKEAKVDVPPGSSHAMTRFMINALTLKKASFTATFGR